MLARPNQPLLVPMQRSVKVPGSRPFRMMKDEMPCLLRRLRYFAAELVNPWAFNQ